MRRFSIAVAVLSLILLPVVASALTLSGDSRTYLIGREGSDDSKYWPFYEYLDFNVDGIGAAQVSFHFGGWGRLDLADKNPAFGTRSADGDIQYAYFTFRKDTGNTIVNLGRVPVFEGVASEIVDGLYAKTDFKYGFGVSAYAGNPVETTYFERDTDFIYGARLKYDVPNNIARIGVSYLKEDGNSQTRREEEGADLWVMPLKNVNIMGRSSYNSETDGWMEHDYRLVVGPFSNFTITPFLQWISYKDYFTSYSSSAFNFSLVPEIINPNDKVLILGGQADYAIYKQIVVDADYKHFHYDLSGNADYFGGKVTYQIPIFKAGGVGLGYHRMNGQNDEFKYDEYRIFAYEKRGKADVTADFLLIHYDDPINSVKTATTALLAGGYDITKATRVAADVSYSHDPYFRNDWRGLFKLIYKFNYAQAEKKGGYNK